MRQSADLKLGLDKLSIACDVDPIVGLGETESTPAETALHRATSENGDSSFWNEHHIGHDVEEFSITSSNGQGDDDHKPTPPTTTKTSVGSMWTPPNRRRSHLPRCPVGSVGGFPDVLGCTETAAVAVPPSVYIYPPEGGEKIARAGDESVVLTTTCFGSKPRS
jgi:hypothetical protein